MANYFYEIIVDDTVVGVGTSRDMIRYQKKHNILLGCDEEQGEYIMYDGNLYHADWMLSVNADSTYEYVDAKVLQIDEETYNALVAAIESNETIVVEDEVEATEDETVYEEGEEITIEYVRNAKIAEMNATTESVIEAGIDVELSDGETHHFSLTVQNQLNLATLLTLANSGQTAIPYHADGEACKFYSAEDIATISSAALAYITYHTSYYNSLKSYVESLESVEEIAAVYYGIEIPEEYQSEVLKQLLASE